MAKTELKQIKIKLVRSLIGASDKQRRVVTGLGLSKQDQVVEHYNSATILGMVNKVPHLVQIVEQLLIAYSLRAIVIIIERVADLRTDGVNKVNESGERTD